MMIFRLLFKLKGWSVVIKEDIDREALKRGVFLAVPHTSNWDAVLAFAAMNKLGYRMRFAIKREWMKFPYNIAFGPMGGIGIDRRPQGERKEKVSAVDAMVKLFEKKKELSLLISPEGTRRRVDKWKKGFYFVALKANVPVALTSLNYETKEAGIIDVFYPTGDVDKDMREITKIYKDYGVKPAVPELFAYDKRYE